MENVKIAFSAGIENHPDTKERLLAYRETMEKHDLPVTENMIAYGDFSEFSENQAKH
jgi:DNA-binding LacI/PurR family transcriptional regulator